MKIRDKLFLGFGLYIFLAVILGFFAYKELRTISTRLTLVETTDDITNTILEVRRYEKNFLLFKDRESYEELQKYLDTLKKNIDAIQTEIVREIGSDNYTMMKSAIVTYERLIENIYENFSSQAELEKLVQKQGRTVERRLSGGPPRLARPEIKNYEKLFGRMYHLYEGEKEAIEKLRLTAREIQSFTQNLSKRERADIATMIKMSINLLVLALVLVVVLGFIINIKLATSIATPIRTLENITKKIAQGDFSEHIEVKGQDELSSLEASFNLMEEKLKNALSRWNIRSRCCREKQAQLVEAEKLASVGKLAAGIAHEINNPLTSVLTFSNLMLEQCPPSDPRHEKLKLMARETNRARNIVRQLLNFGREIVIKPEKININQPVSEIAGLARSAGRLQGHRAFADARRQPSRRSGGPRPDRTGGHEHAPERHPRHIAAGQDRGRYATERRRGRDRLFRYRPGDTGRTHPQDLRPLLYHQGRIQGHGARPGRELWYH